MGRYSNDLELRTAVSEDFDFLYLLHRTALGDYVDQTWGWDDCWQREHLRQGFKPAANQIVMVRGQPVGVLRVGSAEEEIFIASIELLPEYQGGGTGTTLINSILDQAQREGRRVTLSVLKVNHRAMKLYERLGFSTLEETDTHYQYQMRRCLVGPGLSNPGAQSLVLMRH